MAYATPAQFHAKFGLDEATQLLADEQNLLTGLLLTDAIGVAAGCLWTGEPTEAEQVAALASLARLSEQLETSSNYMDGYLRGAVTLPLALEDASAGVLRDCCLALARCGLADDADNATDRIKEAANGWRTWLKDIQAGRAQLVSGAGAAVAGRGRIKTGQASSGYNWAGFGAAS